MTSGRTWFRRSRVLCWRCHREYPAPSSHNGTPPGLRRDGGPRRSAAEIAAGSTIELITAILNDEINSGFAIVRPPGHHASESEPSGFCYFNNVALAAMVAKQNNKKVAVVDWDVHYGNGTASILSNIDDVSFFSIHRHDNGGFYPYNGECSNVTNIHNYPMNKHCGDEEFISVFIEYIIPQSSFQMAFQFGKIIIWTSPRRYEVICIMVEVDCKIENTC